LFALPAVLVAFALVLSWKVVPNSREQSDKRFDTVGSITSFLAIGGLVLGIHEGPDRGWTDPITIIGLVVGVVAFAAFIIWELHCPDPLLDVRAFADRALAVGTFTLLLVFGVMFGIFLVLFPYLQGVLGWSALHAAVAILPLAAVMMPMSTLAPRVSARFGIRLTILAGLTLVGTGLTMLALQASVDGGYWSVLPGLLILGLGMGLSMTPSTVAITSSLPADKQGVASALNDTSRELGGALGVALLGSIVNAGYRSSIASTTAQLPPPVANTVERGLGAALAVGNQLGADGQTIITAAQHAFVDGWVHGMWIGVGLIAVGWLFVAIRGPRAQLADQADPYLAETRSAAHAMTSDEQMCPRSSTELAPPDPA
jgi:predicted MFS family arabinose efflux permease